MKLYGGKYQKHRSNFSKRNWKLIIIRNFKKNLFKIIYTLLYSIFLPYSLFIILKTVLPEGNFSLIDFMIFMIPLILTGLLRLVYLLFFNKY